MIYTITGPRMVELHPTGCDCGTCHPLGSRARNETVASPHERMWITLDENDRAPDGWQRVGGRKDQRG